MNINFDRWGFKQFINRWMDKQTNDLLDERTYGRTDERTYGRTDERTNGRTDGQKVGQTIGQTDIRAISVGAKKMAGVYSCEIF